MSQYRTVLDLVAEQARKSPSAVAARFGCHTLTYDELWRRSDNYAHGLRASGVGAGNRVGICVDRGLELAVVVLAVLKSGAAYVPLDPSYPKQRLDLMVADSEVALVVCSEPYYSMFSASFRVEVISEDSFNVGPGFEPHDGEAIGNLCYLIYTSGSTGRPKAVAMSHTALLNLVQWQISLPGFEKPSIALQFTPLSFDVHFQEFFGTWAAGGTLVFIDDETRRDPIALLKQIVTHAVERLFLPFVGLQQLAEAAVRFGPLPNSLKEIVTAGEQLVVNRTLRSFFQKLPYCRLHNHYGPSETHVVTSYTLSGSPESWPALPPIGSAIIGAELWVFGEDLSPVAEGEPGELWVGGVVLADGYWQRPDLTAERFVSRPELPSPERLYRTGDLVRRGDNGVIEYLGRIDSQVKIRGHRVEIGEVEAAIQIEPAVRECAVLARQDHSGERALIAYLTLNANCFPAAAAIERTERERWFDLAESAYSQPCDKSQELDSRGWTNSFDGIPIPQREMRQWLEDSAAWINRYSPRRILEIQCGVGLLSERLISASEYYHAIDNSVVAIDQLRHKLSRQPQGEWVAEVRAPHTIGDLIEKRFDTVIITAATQYFLSLDYVEQVIAAAAELIEEEGVILLSDVTGREQKTLLFIAQELASHGDVPLAQLHANVTKRCAADRELSIEAEFFHTLRARLSRIKAVRVDLKQGEYRNELSLYRYDVALEIGPAPTARSTPQWIDWSASLTTLSDLDDLLRERAGEAVAVRAVPNCRLAALADIHTKLIQPDAAGDQSLTVLSAVDGYEPDELRQLAKRHERSVQLSFTTNQPGFFNAVFGPGGERSWCADLSMPERELASFANNPLNAACFGQVVASLRQQLRHSLPEYMHPARFVLLEHMPWTPSGKLNRRALPEPVDTRPESAGTFTTPNSGHEAILADIWKEILELESVGADDDFFELGGSSIKAQTCCAQLKAAHGLTLSVTALYELRTIRRIAAHVDNRLDHQVLAVKPDAGAADRHDIAVIGLAGRVPGARTAAQFWANLTAGRESITFFDFSELDPSVAARARADSNYVRARGVVPEAEFFDASFFGMNAREAEITDPQQRVFLETAWEAMEDAGLAPDAETPQRVGVFAGVGVNSYYVTNVIPVRGADAGVSEIQRIIATEKDYVASRVAHKLNLTGPAVAVSTACSTSLVAVIQACMSLRNGFCDVAIAGGSSVHTPQPSGYLYQEAGALSPDGHTRSFSKDAAGTTFNGGAGAVILKPLAQAIADGDRIYCTIRGVGLNNDGTDKASFMAPSTRGQAEAVLQAQLDAGVEASSISYVEAHGTATPIGDPIEVEALKRAFVANGAGDRTGFCGIGTAKSNVGHLIAAAGVTGLIKVSLALHNRQLPATLHYTGPNPEIDFASSPFYVVDRLQPWDVPAGAPRLAGVSSFGVGGTNAHVVVEEAPREARDAGERAPVDIAPELLLLSAKKADRLPLMRANLADFIVAAPETAWPAIAWTLQRGRARFPQRQFVVLDPAQPAGALLREPPKTHTKTSVYDGIKRGVVFMFPGQGSQYVGMGQGLYQRYPVFREVADQCFEILRPRLPRDLRGVMFATPGTDLDAAAALLKETQYTQPALFLVEYALARLWMSWGVQPTALIGHSIGEFVAATLAGVFTLEEGLALVVERARLMQSQPHGAMLAVSAAADTLRPQLPASCDIAAINGPALCVVAGPNEEVDALALRWQAEGLQAKRLHTSHAFHSPMMDAVIPPFSKFLEGVTPNAPAIPIMSTVDVAWLSAERATDRGYWARHLRETVKFADGSRALLQGEPALYLEVGPRNTAATLTAQQMRGGPRQPVVTSLGAISAPDERAEQVAILAAAGELWLSGIEVAWPALHAQQPRIVSLPTYPFARDRHWINVDPQQVDPIAATLSQPLTIAQPFVTADVSSIALPPETMPASFALPLIAAPVVAAPITAGVVPMDQQAQLLNELRDLFADSSGEDLSQVAPDISFLELGFDSLFLTQAALAIKKRYKVDIPFRRLLSDLADFGSLAGMLTKEADPALLPSAAPAQPIAAALVAQQPAVAAVAAPTVAMAMPTLPVASVPISAAQLAGVQGLIQQQLLLMTQQLQMLGGAGVITAGAAVAPVAQPQAPIQPQPVSTLAAPTQAAPAATPVTYPTAPEEKPAAKPFGAQTRIDAASKDEFTPTQLKHFQQLLGEYTALTSKSKAFTAKARPQLSDPRVASGFRPAVKEITYPIVVDRSKGTRLWDIDGNEYIDTLCGYGSMYFGYQPEWIVKALNEQLERGMEIGPQHPLTHEIIELLNEILPHDRYAFCNTGSEAVLGAMRMVRTATGRNKIVMFTGDYHGIVDEVIVRGGRNNKSFPAAAGIPPEAVQNMIVLEYGSDEALDYIRDNADDIAAALVEPVQSRNPNFVPVEFLKKLRVLTEEKDIGLIFDEVITGFRVAAGGFQEYSGIQADICTYGKVIGGGISLGLIAGQSRFMDTLDGGAWGFGDDSKPEVGVTYFAGTFVRHPLALAAAKAVLLHMKEQGADLHKTVNARATQFAADLNLHFKRVNAPMEIEQFCSMMYFKFKEDLAWGELMFADMRRQGIHAWYGRPMFVSVAHTDDDLAKIRAVFMRSLARMQEWGFIPGSSRDDLGRELAPPEAGAKLGIDALGNPAWFVEDTSMPNGLRQVSTSFE